MKTCIICEKILPVTDFSYRPDRGKLYNVCKSCFNQRSRKWVKNNPIKAKIIGHRKIVKHRDKKKKYFKSYNKERKKNPLYRLRMNLRRRIHLALRDGYAKKSERFKNLIGCNPDELKQHLQKQFKVGMAWDNYGKWHVDHIIPCKRFNLMDIREQRVCFNFSNLQPLWAFDNLSKGAK